MNVWPQAARIPQELVSSDLVARPATRRLLGLDSVRVLALLGVVLYHSVAAYSTNTPYWRVHDGSSMIATDIRELVDVFIMPLFFFLAGYFTLGSLRKKGHWSYFKGKFWELGYVWLVVVLLVIPFISWAGARQTGAAGSYLGSWSSWLEGIGETRLGVFETNAQVIHMHFWFISLLFLFFVVFVLLHKAGSRFWPASVKITPSGRSSTVPTSVILAGFGLATGLVYFGSLLLWPDTSWLTVKLFLQFQPTKLCIFAAYFGLGIYAYSRNWLSDGLPLGRLRVWAPVAALLAVGFMVVGQRVFEHAASTQTLAPAYLLAYAFARAFLLLAILVTVCSLGVRYFNRPSHFISTLVDNSYYIYLVHLIFIAMLQDILLEVWPGGSLGVKIVVVFVVGLSVSYAMSRWIVKKIPRWWGLGAMCCLFLALPIVMGALR